MPASVLLTVTASCSPTGGVLSLSCRTLSTGQPYVEVLVQSVDGETFFADIVYKSQHTFVATGLSDGVYTIRLTDHTDASESKTATVSCGAVPLRLTATATAPTAEAGRGVLTATPLGGTAPLTLSIVQTGASQAGYDGQPASFLLPTGTYAVQATDSSSPAQVVTVSVVVPVYVELSAPGVVLCQNPEADNYLDPAGGACVFSPKVALDPLPDLVALGRPALVTLHSAEILWATPAPARLVITVGALSAGGTLTLNGYSFTVGALTRPGRFNDALSLLDVLLATPALVAAYSIELVAATKVELKARQVGYLYDVVASATGAGLSFQAYAGQDMYYSQARRGWSVWLEVWAVPAAAFGPGQGKGGAVLAATFETRIRTDNTYQFDIAEPLRQFTGLSYAANDRLTGYFLRYGEAYAQSSTGPSRRQRVGESNVLFGLEAVEIVSPAVLVPGGGGLAGFPYELPVAFNGPANGGANGTVAGWRRLSRRPGLLPLAGCLTTILNPTYSGALAVAATHRTATGGLSVAAAVTSLAGGGLTTLLAASLQAPATVERSQALTGGNVLVEAQGMGAGAQVLSFANGQGGMESVVFGPLPLLTAKRSALLYSTSTGTRTYAARLDDTRRLSTGPLSQLVYEWLLVELGNSPAVWLETPDGPLAVNLTDFDGSADYAAGDFSLSVEIEPTEQPARGLTT